MRLIYCIDFNRKNIFSASLRLCVKNWTGGGPRVGQDGSQVSQILGQPVQKMTQEKGKKGGAGDD